MGLNVSHGAFDGAYSAFNRFRQAVGKACGVNYPPHDEDRKDLHPDFMYFPDELNEKAAPGLREFFTHNDCEGEISPEMCVHVANELEALMPYFKALTPEYNTDYGHITRYNGYTQILQNFIDGCREAARRNEPLEFR